MGLLVSDYGHGHGDDDEMNAPASARLVTTDSLPALTQGQGSRALVRLYARVLAYDAHSARALVASTDSPSFETSDSREHVALLCDLSLVAGKQGHAYAPREKDVVMLLGDLCDPAAHDSDASTSAKGGGSVFDGGGVPSPRDPVLRELMATRFFRLEGRYILVPLLLKHCGDDKLDLAQWRDAVKAVNET